MMAPQGLGGGLHGLGFRALNEEGETGTQKEKDRWSVVGGGETRGGAEGKRESGGG